MLEVIRTLELPLPGAPLQDLYGRFPDLVSSVEANKGALHRHILHNDVYVRDVVCARWTCEAEEYTSRRRGGERVQHALEEVQRLGYSPAPISATIVAELNGLVPHDGGRSSHLSLQTLLPEPPDPEQMRPEYAPMQRIFNSVFGPTHFTCLAFETSLGSRRAFFFARETMSEIVPGSIVLLVPKSAGN